MQNFSLTISGLAVGILSWFFTQSGYTLPAEQVQSFVETFGIFISAVMVWYGRFRQGDINWFGQKQPKKR